MRVVAELNLGEWFADGDGDWQVASRGDDGCVVITNRYGGKSVVLNPKVYPAREIEKPLGKDTK